MNINRPSLDRKMVETIKNCLIGIEGRWIGMEHDEHYQLAIKTITELDNNLDILEQRLQELNTALNDLASSVGVKL